MKQKLNDYKGITLVALIITIIVLLILAVVAISAVSGNGILNHAQNAKKEFLQAQTNEQAMLQGYLDHLEESQLASRKVKDNLNKVLSTSGNLTLEDDFGNKIKVPAGFKILVDDTTGYTADTINVTKGIVVEDEEGNQFVWIPVGTIYTNAEKTESKTITLGRYSNFTKTNGEYTVTQKASEYATSITRSTYGGKVVENTSANHGADYKNAIAKNIGEFCTKTNSSGGYYIARYEARVENYDSSNISTSNSNKSTDWTGYVAESGKSLKLVSKANSQVWNYVTQNKASSLCQSMYTNKPYESDLANSYAWDTAIIFFQEFGNNSAYASKASVNKSLANTGTSGTSYSGEKDVICNVYDMASNCMEWSTETFNSSSYPCVVSGGSSGSSAGTSSRGYSVINLTSIDATTSFRPVLYM